MLKGRSWTPQQTTAARSQVHALPLSSLSFSILKFFSKLGDTIMQVEEEEQRAAEWRLCDAATKGKKAQIKTYPNGFVIETVAQGNAAGKLAKPGKKVVVKYVGKLVKTGKVFDQTKGNKTFTFRLGVGEVIKG